MKFKKPSRKSEMISLGYFLLSLMGDFILDPFQALSDDEYFEELKKVKKNIKTSNLCHSTKSKVLKNYLDEVFSYEYDEEPFYAKLRHLLVIELLKHDQYPSADLFGNSV